MLPLSDNPLIPFGRLLSRVYTFHAKDVVILRRYTEYEYEIGKVIGENIEYSPCQLKTCSTVHRCMTMIAPKKVIQTCVKVLGIQVKKITKKSQNHFINIS